MLRKSTENNKEMGETLFNILIKTQQVEENLAQKILKLENAQKSDIEKKE